MQMLRRNILPATAARLVLNNKLKQVKLNALISDFLRFSKKTIRFPG